MSLMGSSLSHADEGAPPPPPHPAPHPHPPKKDPARPHKKGKEKGGDLLEKLEDAGASESTIDSYKDRLKDASRIEDAGDRKAALEEIGNDANDYIDEHD